MVGSARAKEVGFSAVEQPFMAHGKKDAFEKVA